jgi:hypothetical protein
VLPWDVARRWIALAFVALAAGTAAADPAAADHAAAEAEALAKAGKFGAAADKFREAWHADKLRSELFCNIGISYYKAKDLVRAHLLLGLCLEQAALDPGVVETVRAVIASVENVLRGGGHAPVRIVVEPTATSVAIVELLPDEAFVGSPVVWLPLGTYHLAGHAEGYADAAVAVTTASQDPTTVTIALHRPPPPGPGRDVRDARDAKVEGGSRESAAPPSRTPAYLATGGAAVALGVATLAFIAGHARADLASSALDGETLAADRDAVSRWNTTLVIAGSAAIATGALGGYLWYRALRSEPKLEVHAGPDGAGVALLGRF